MIMKLLHGKNESGGKAKHWLNNSFQNGEGLESKFVMKEDQAIISTWSTEKSVLKFPSTVLVWAQGRDGN